MTISSMIKRNLSQTAVYWQRTGNDRYNQPTFADAVEINCRWEEKIQVVTDSQGKEVVSNTQVFVDRDVSEQDYLFLGGLGNLDSADEENPIAAEGAYEVKSKGKIPALGKKKKFLKIAYLG